MLLNIFGPVFICIQFISLGRIITRTNLLYFIVSSFVLLFYFNLISYYIIIFNTGISTYNFGIFLDIQQILIKYEFILDQISITIILIINLIAFGIFIYSIDYIYEDPHLVRFINYLYLFISFIFILVTGLNLIILFIGQEGVGICSYLLISFQATRLQALKAALKAIIINKIGDLFFLIGCSVFFYIFITLDLHITILYSNLFIIFKELKIINLCFLFAICAKSAQIGLHTQLPAAIEGPTPVSALIHAATIVTAGIILFIRLFNLFQLDQQFIILCIFIGGITALISALTAIFLFDIKKIIAYSTCSQLGYMLVCCSIYFPIIGFNHLINHAFFKALLFLTAGSIIHYYNNEQDIRYLKQIAFNIPIEFLAILIGNFCIIGIPFLTGYYSKDMILEISYLQGLNYFYLTYQFLFLAAVGTGFYSIRLFFELFLNVKNNKLFIIKNNLPLIQIVIIFLSLLSLVIGYVILDFFDSTLIITILNIKIYLIMHCELLNIIKLLPLCYSVYVIQLVSKKNNIDRKLIINQLVKQGFILNFFFNEYYNRISLQYINNAYTILINNDKGFFEQIGPSGLSRLIEYCIKQNIIFLIKIIPQLHIIIQFFICIIIILFII